MLIKTKWPADRIREEKLDRKANRVRARQRHKTSKKQAPPDLRGIVLHDGRRSQKDIPYKEYLLTSHWCKVRMKALALANNRCSICDRENHLEVHHVIYDNLWHEYANDIVVLCGTCHSLLHGKMIRYR